MKCLIVKMHAPVVVVGRSACITTLRAGGRKIELVRPLLLMLKMQPEIGGSWSVCEGHTLDLWRVKHEHSKRSGLEHALRCSNMQFFINFMLI